MYIVTLRAQGQGPAIPTPSQPHSGWCKSQSTFLTVSLSQASRQGIAKANGAEHSASHDCAAPNRSLKVPLPPSQQCVGTCHPTAGHDQDLFSILADRKKNKKQINPGYLTVILRQLGCMFECLLDTLFIY